MRVLFQWLVTSSIVGFGVASIAACSSEEGSRPPFDDVDVTGRDVNPDGIAYPTDDWGARPRNGTTPGQRLPNFSFQGYPDSKQDDGLQVVSFADFYDPSQQRHKVMYLVAVVAWCPHCQAETRAIAANSSAFRANGVQVVQTVMEGAERGRPLSLVDVDEWVDTMGTDFTVLIDVNAKRLGSVADIEGVPWNALVDTRSMEVLAVTVGELVDVPGYVDLGLTWVATHEARP
ncbi:MAG: hypothetical protein CVU63_17355 [Deltaproteobacteria bacterium HGW-Deltaproteobacteria-20]|jgi:thiol-disulfide isomerase/thioredoxin|nr:MAG: hypothetical protein CVU63_17355 [Deltaproteobacteria bacterium HGW-Deltaproteobacteria-20]